jgi:hypothetical protein
MLQLESDDSKVCAMILKDSEGDIGIFFAQWVGAEPGNQGVEINFF